MPSAKVSIPTGSTPTLISAARERQSFVFQNQGTAPVYVAWDKTASAVTIDTGGFPGLKLEAGESFGFSADVKHPVPAFSGAIYGVHGDASTQTGSLQEI